MVPERPPPATVAVSTESPSGAVGETLTTSSTGSLAPAASDVVRLQVSVLAEHIQPVPALAPASVLAVRPGGSRRVRFSVASAAVVVLVSVTLMVTLSAASPGAKAVDGALVKPRVTVGVVVALMGVSKVNCITVLPTAGSLRVAQDCAGGLIPVWSFLVT